MRPSDSNIKRVEICRFTAYYIFYEYIWYILHKSSFIF